MDVLDKLSLWRSIYVLREDMSALKMRMKTIEENQMTDTPVADARKTIAKAFEADPDFRDGYVANVAMLLHDRYGITDYDTRNKAGDDIVRLIFES